MELLQIVAGFVTGTMVGLTGVGGGALMTPLLLLLFGTAPMTAVGTDLWFAALTKIAATRIHSHHGLIDWGVVRRLWAGSLPASAAALVWLHFHPMDNESMDALKLVIAAAVVFTAVGILLQRSLHDAGRRLRVTQSEKFKAAQGPATVVAGVIIGLLVTFTSVGAGALGAVLSSRLPHGVLRTALAVVLTLVGLKLWWSVA